MKVPDPGYNLSVLIQSEKLHQVFDPQVYNADKKEDKRKETQDLSEVGHTYRSVSADIQVQSSECTESDNLE